MFRNHPEIAKRWAAEHPESAHSTTLPEHVANAQPGSKYREFLHPRQHGKWVRKSAGNPASHPHASAEMPSPRPSGEPSKPAGKPKKAVSIFIHGNVSAMDKMAARAIVEQSEVGAQAVESVRVVGHDVDQGSFTVNGVQWQRGGSWHKDTKQIVSTNEPEVMAHEMGHACFEWGKDRMADGMRDSISRFIKNELLAGTPMHSINPYESKNWDEHLLTPGDTFAYPESASEHAWNALKDFENEVLYKDGHPSSYSRAWSNENVWDEVDGGSPTWTSPPGQDGTVNTVRIPTATHRGVNEAYAEFSAGFAVKQMVKNGWMDESRYVFGKMGTKESRAAYLKLRKAFSELAKERI